MVKIQNISNIREDTILEYEGNLLTGEELYETFK